MIRHEQRLVFAGRSGDDRVGCFEQPHGHLLVVADGAGGTGAGSEAAQQLVDAVQHIDGNADLVSTLGRLDQALLDTGHGGETTAVLVRVTDGVISGASVGDSAAWIVADHVDDLTRAQVRKPLVGSGRAWPVAFSAPMVGRLLIASDGLLKYVNHQAITSLARTGTLTEAADALINAARLPTGGLQDDIALIIAESTTHQME